MRLSSIEAHRIWAPTYDTGPNPLLALETRVLAAHLGDVSGKRILDAACGTGRWMAWAAQNGAHVFGFDACAEMLSQAAHKPGLHGRTAVADLTALPFCDNAADLAICSLALSYTHSPEKAVGEIRRVAPLVFIIDLHPAAIENGWTRSFRSEGGLYEVETFDYDPDFPASLGLKRAWRTDAYFDEQELPIFNAAGKESAYETLRHVPALLITAWTL